MVSPAEAAVTAACIVTQFGSATVQAPALPGLTCQVLAALTAGASSASEAQSAATRKSESAGSLRRTKALAKGLRPVRFILILPVTLISRMDSPAVVD